MPSEHTSIDFPNGVKFVDMQEMAHYCHDLGIDLVFVVRAHDCTNGEREWQDFVEHVSLDRAMLGYIDHVERGGYRKRIIGMGAVIANDHRSLFDLRYRGILTYVDL